MGIDSHQGAHGSNEVVQPWAALVLHCRDQPRLVRIPPGRSVIIGRQPPSDVEIPDASLSRQHARLAWDGERCRVVDLNSTNGTHVAGKAVAEAAVEPGEVIAFGAVTGRVSVGVPIDPAFALAALPASAAMAEVDARLTQLAGVSQTVFIGGERGVGKRALAASLHARCGGGPFVAYEGAGARTAGVARALFGDGSASPGVLARGLGGTLYLDEVHALPSELQVRLAQAMASRAGAVGPTGGVSQLRLVVGGPRRLPELTAAGAVVEAIATLVGEHQVWVPPLRERRSEVRPLACALLDEAVRAWQRPRLRLGVRTLEILEQFPFPGNLRQLCGAIEFAALVCRSATIQPEDLPPAMRVVQTLPLCPPEMGSSAPTAGSDGGPALRMDEDDGRDFKTRVREFEAGLILAGLRRTGGNQRAASRLLRIPLRTLAHKIKDYGIKDRL